MSINDHELQFRKWIDEHSGIVLKVVRSFADGPDDADDLFQEILLQLWLSLPNFGNGSKPITWIYRVAFNTALSWKRTEKRRWRRQASVSISDIARPGITSAEAERNDRIVDQLYKAIRQLPPAKRALLVLYLDGFTYHDIAEVLGVSESNVGVSLNRIKKDLEATLKDDGNELD